MTILDRIMARKREEVAELQSAAAATGLRERARQTDPTRGFAEVLIRRVHQGEVSIIAEIKRASPSKGVIYHADQTTVAPPFDPAAIAVGYERYGATCLSCLTDRDFFQGDGAYLTAVRQRSGLPVLRKDFLYDPLQVVESRALGADAILLIMAVLSVPQARELEDAAAEYGMDVLVEVHNVAELEAAHELMTPLMGINNRNLQTFVTRLETSLELAARVAPDRVVVSESGIDGAATVERLRLGGIQAFLIGELFMKEANPGAALGRMLRHCVP